MKVLVNASPLSVGLTAQGARHRFLKMDSRRKRLARLRSASTSADRSRSATPSQQHASHRPSVARRALIMGLSLEGPKRKSPECDVIPAKRNALVVSQTPGGSFRPSGDTVPVSQSPGGRVYRDAMDPSPPKFDILERVEALDMSDEEVEDLLVQHPGHVQRWIGGLAQLGRECRTPKPLSPTTTAGDDLNKASGIVGVHEPSNTVTEFRVSSVDADVRPSTSGFQGTTSKPVRGWEDQGSDLDSEFDDEFDVAPIQTTALAGAGRDIPDDEELEEPVRDVIHAVERAMDDEADRLLGVSSSFDWSEDFDSFRGVPEVFSGPSPGAIKDYDRPYDAFTDIWSKDIMELIAQETNRYAKQTIDALKAEGTLKPSSRLHQWHDTDADEIAVLFAVFMYMGIAIRSCQYEYWKANDYLEMSRFKDLLSYNRYILLSKFLHFVDNSDVSQSLSHSGDLASKRLAKLQPVITHLSSKFTTLYNLHRDISIDESLTLFKGRLSFVQVIRSKAARFGIKSYELCESHTGYLYKFVIYTGKNSDNSSAAVAPSVDLGGKTTQVVLGLLKDLEHQGHCITMDNFYNCPSLARYLKSRGFDCLGTLRVNRKHVPRDISRIPKNVEKGAITARQCGDVSIIAWKDSKLVTMISTYHTDETYIGSKAGKVLVKPVCVKDYNNTMGGVDLKDQKLSMYLLERKRGVKWYVKMFKRLLNVSIHNAFILYLSSLRRRNMVALTHREFRYKLAKSLVEEHHRRPPAIRERVEVVMRLRRDVVHEPKYEPGRNKRKRCRVCTMQNKDKMVHTKCETCDEFLCFETCWKEWHSLPKLKGQEVRGRKRSRNE